MKKFLQKYVVVITLFALTCASALTYMTFAWPPSDAIILSDLPGPQGQLSPRSKRELQVLLYPNPSVVGAWVSKIHYAKTENPIVWFGGGHSKFEGVIKQYIDRQEKSLNYSSRELASFGSATLRNTYASLIGDISCAPLAMTALPKVAPKASDIANMVCRAPIPPFNPAANLALVVLLNADGEDDKRVEAVRKIILQLQIDIYNRDFLAREIWIHN